VIDQAIAAARATVGTPFHHQGRQPGLGMDCIGVIVEAGKVFGVREPEVPRYSRQPNWEEFIGSIERAGLREINPEDVRQGDVLVFKVGRNQPHVALLAADDRIIHAHMGIKRVVEAGLSKAWRSRIVKVYRFPGEQ
jgi:NlpC/P60 family putative phage cell wall peptidase